ncbi:YueI family protein [Barrientosiimonas marina]|uniref:YueI family protein n=1 Tax=Lentibacillus kimchii TaxID=1542911 RepID=A0ABW2USS2_9BACI
MAKKNVDDYLTEGIYGARQTKPSERKRFLGTLRERIVLALTKGQIMHNKGLQDLEEAMRTYPDATLLINGKVARRFLKKEIALARQYHIPYTEITNEEAETDIGAVLTYGYALNLNAIFATDDPAKKPDKDTSFFSKIKRWFS